jgi:hypothetical protein
MAFGSKRKGYTFLFDEADGFNALGLALVKKKV